VPAQCPECARFLSKDFVAGLAVEPANCPKCGRELTVAEFPEVFGPAEDLQEVDEPAGAAVLRDTEPGDLGPGEAPGEPPVEESAPAGAPSVRPPDLDPTDVRVADDGGPDPLAGWDESAASVLDLEAYRDRGIAPPPDGVIVAGAGLFGALLGLLLARRRGRGALFGALLGLIAGGAARQVWRLED
jgi:hypothetical protein